MKAELCAKMAYADLERAYQAYNVLMQVYEVTAGGPYAARQYREYFAICDSRDNIRREVLNRSNSKNHGQS